LLPAISKEYNNGVVLVHYVHIINVLFVVFVGNDVGNVKPVMINKIALDPDKGKRV
jgi:hypothetical protein